MITTRDEYEYAKGRGYEPLIDERLPMDINIRKEIQKERFGKNNAEGNRKFYRFCIENSSHFCEECGKFIPCPSAVNVSHILTRGAHPEKAHDPRNVNILCYECHARWENGDRQNMKIYEKNQKIIEKLREEYV